MKRISLGPACLAVLAAALALPGSGSASAPTPLPQSASWSGLYLGVHGGASAGDYGGIFDDAGTEPFATFGTFETTDLHGGVQAGYNLDLGGFILGIEGDYSWDGPDGSVVDGEDDLQRLKTDYLATVRGRIGAAADNVFVYLTAGVAFTEQNLIVENGSDRLTFDATGFVYGAGVEYGLMPGVSLRAEVMRLDFDENFRSTDQLDNGSTGALDRLDDGDDDDHLSFEGINVARVGINIRPGEMMGFRSSGSYERAPVADFSGPYVGGTVGYGDTDVGGVFDTAGTAPFAEFSLFDMDGVNGSVQVGFNFQSGAIVYGIEADYAWNDSSDSFIDGEDDLQELSSDFFATIRGRIGVVHRDMLFYATAGVAFGELDLTVENGTDSLSLEATGFAFGGGVEYAITDRITIKAEYLRLAFDEAAVGTDNGVLDDLSDGDDDDSLNFDGHDIVRIGVNLKLGSLFSR